MIGGRFELSHPDVGVIEHFQTLRAAQSNAEDYAPNGGCEVFDRMARRGHPELWKHLGRGGGCSTTGNWTVARVKARS
jgi:hypothetical protein